MFCCMESFITKLHCFVGVVHENPRILSDGESEEISITSNPSSREDVVSAVRLRNRQRRYSQVQKL